jgi:anti-sigma B factor antagonist
MQLVATASPASGAVQLTVRGELDIASAPELQTALERLLAGPHDVLVLDLAGLSFLDCAGMRPIRTARRTLEARGGRLLVRHPSPIVERALRLGGLGEALSAGRAGV